MFITVDKKDNYREGAYTEQEALVNAINHCITEGLTVISIDKIEDSITIVYIDPDDNTAEDIAIYPINE